jgi:hypothetical protein
MMLNTENDSMMRGFSRATLAEHFEFHSRLARQGGPLATEMLKFFGCEDVALAMRELRVPAYELPNVHRALRRQFRHWRLEFCGGEAHAYSKPIWAPLYRRVQVRPGKFRSYLASGSQFYRLPGGGSRVLLFEEECCPPEAVCTLVGPREEAAQLRREMGAIASWGKRHHYLRRQTLRGDGTLLKRGPRVTWEDVALAPQVRAALEANTFGILGRRKLFKTNGIPQKRGVLLYGPPGTGKTMIGKVLADMHRGTFVWATAADVKTCDSVRTIFTMARKLRPTIVFLEDLDMFASERGGATDVTLGELLTQMDGLESNDGVIVVATTNDLSAIEPALAERPSRFDVVLEVGLPAAAARRRILLQNLSKQAPPDDVLDCAATATEGCTGAQIREVAFLAVQRALLRGAVDADGRALLEFDDVQAAAEKMGVKTKRGPIGFRTDAE